MEEGNHKERNQNEGGKEGKEGSMEERKGTKEGGKIGRNARRKMGR